MPDDDPTRPRAPKREAILDAALEVFAERGVRGVAVPEIAVRAGVGTGTIYRYFDSKEGLVNELFRQHKQALGQRLAVALARPAGSAHQQFANLWAAQVAFAREHPAAYRFLELQDHLPYLDEASREVERDVLAPIARGVEHAQLAGALRGDVRPDVLVAMLWGSFVHLLKAERQDYLTLSDDDLAGARDALWRAIAPL
ncbi:AcrR family transcriptional regulator [Mumia flava]|uniref:AcrR family transcriptional regulator n=1 Tax=Mumia flava TaxID=1348852 RepID=A0A0B2BB48_9ACTN|nr:TetR/AcrR family transcriptional regulator [Mumia flava]PJJ53979.1 AcrR family transcriptional regulator [Mumia flava]